MQLYAASRRCFVRDTITLWYAWLPLSELGQITAKCCDAGSEAEAQGNPPRQTCQCKAMGEVGLGFRLRPTGEAWRALLHGAIFSCPSHLPVVAVTRGVASTTRHETTLTDRTRTPRNGAMSPPVPRHGKYHARGQTRPERCRASVLGCALDPQDQRDLLRHTMARHATRFGQATRSHLAVAAKTAEALSAPSVSKPSLP